MMPDPIDAIETQLDPTGQLHAAPKPLDRHHWGSVLIPAPLTVIKGWVDAGMEIGLPGVEQSTDAVFLCVGPFIISFAPTPEFAVHDD